MLESFLNFRTFFLLCFLHACVLSESNKSILNSFDKHLVKRHENDFQTCLDNFDVHQDKIIRTQDSQDMGAKYIKERDVYSRDECLRLCCETESCDVFVYEEKSPGSCYLFECGTPEDFKCKFTKHNNYTSAVLAINRHMTELESQIKFTQHEHELTNLRQPPEVPDIPKLHSPTTISPKNQEVINPGIERPPSEAVPTKGGKCSQYQFKCHTSGECIGIYNACDGIPQCADGSDEALELGCPTSTPSPVITTATTSKVEGKIKSVEEHVKEISQTPVVHPQQPYASDMQSGNSGYPQNTVPLPAPLNVPAPNPYYGREGEGMVAHRSDQWPSHLYHQNQGSSQIFNHKGSGIMPPKNDWYYQQHPYIPQDLPQQPVLPQYGDQAQNYYDNMAYRVPPQGQAMNNWQVPHKIHEISGQQEDLGMNRLDRIPVGNPAGPDDYYEEVYRSRPQPYLPQRQPLPQGPPRQNIDNKMRESPMDLSNDDSGAKHDVPKKKPPTEPPVVTTSKPKEVTPIHASHKKADKVSADVKVKETFFDEDIDGHNTSPSGAVLSLTMGLCITGIMLVFVGCRMKVVRRRMRRGGKSPYAHDADFLVNGMYL